MALRPGVVRRGPRGHCRLPVCVDTTPRIARDVRVPVGAGDGEARHLILGAEVELS